MTNITKRNVTCEKHNLEFVADVAEFRGREILSNCPQCQEELKAKEKEEERQAAASHRERVLSNTFMRAGIPPRYTTRTFDNFHADSDAKAKALRIARNYSDNIYDKHKTGAGLILSGRPGTGKTHLACAVANSYIQKGDVLFVTVSAMVRMIRETYRRGSEKTEQEVINDLRDVSLLIIDEIGIQKGTESEEHLLFEVINERYGYYKPTILISNLNLEEIKAFVGERVIDRMREGGGGFIDFSWESYRTNVASDNTLPDADGARYLGGSNKKEIIN